MRSGLPPAAAILVPLGLLIAGCEASVEPLRPDAGPRFDAAALTPADCADEAVTVSWVLAPSCGASDCHDAERPSAGLDLVSPGVSARVVSMTSVHEACEGEPLVTPGIPQGSFLMHKVLAMEGACGDPMPREGDLGLPERRCLVEWIAAMPPR